MINHEIHFDKTNYDDVYIRCVLMGLLGHLRNRYFWYNRSEERGNVKVDIPFFYRLKGDLRYIMDAFYDSLPTKRVNMNTDQIPRGVIGWTSFKPVMEEIANPSTYYMINVENTDNELVQVYSQIKFIPVRITFNVELVFSNLIDIMKACQVMMTNQALYKYFTFDYMNIPLKAIFTYNGEMTNPVLPENSFGTAEEPFKLTMEYEISTAFPMIDYLNIYNSITDNNSNYQHIFQNNTINLNNTNNGNTPFANNPVTWLLNSEEEPQPLPIPVEDVNMDDDDVESSGYD